MNKAPKKAVPATGQHYKQRTDDLVSLNVKKLQNSYYSLN